jgi:pectin methylesterase-like acyl-CoA thioesterase
MKKAFFCLALCLASCLTLTGCPSATTTTTPSAALAPGYANSTDQQLGETLAAANGFYNKLAADQKAGTFKPTSKEVTALNVLQSALSVADPVYLDYHNGRQTLQAAQEAVDRVQAAQTNVQTMIGATK